MKNELFEEIKFFCDKQNEQVFFFNSPLKLNIVDQINKKKFNIFPLQWNAYSNKYKSIKFETKVKESNKIRTTSCQYKKVWWW